MKNAIFIWLSDLQNMKQDYIDKFYDYHIDVVGAYYTETKDQSSGEIVAIWWFSFRKFKFID